MTEDGDRTGASGDRSVSDDRIAEDGDAGAEDGDAGAEDGKAGTDDADAGADDGDRTLDLIGIALVGFIVVAIGVGILAITVLSPGGGAETPDADWVLNRVNDTHVQIGHAGGDDVVSENLVVTVDGTERSTTFPSEVSRGEAGLVRAAPGVTVRLYWTGGSGDRELLAVWNDTAAIRPPGPSGG